MSVSRRTFWTGVSVFVFAFVVRFGHWLVKGTQISGDTQGFIRICDGLATDPIAALLSYRGLLFSGFTLPFCGLQGVTGGSPDAWVLLQLFLSALACVLIFDAGRRLYSFPAGVVAGLGLAVLFETFSWSIWLLSDTLFVFGVTLSIWALARYHVHRSRSTRIVALLALVWVATIRPVGIPIVLLWLASDALPDRYQEFRLGLLPRKIALAAIVVGAIALLSVFVIFQEALLNNRIIRYFAEGVVIVNDPTFDYAYSAVQSDSLVGFIVGNFPHLIIVSAIRSLVFYIPFVLRFDALHIAINLVTYLPMLVASIVGVISMLRARRPETPILLVPIIAVTATIAVTWLTHGFRYRAPLGPVFVLLTAYTLTVAPRTGKIGRRLVTTARERVRWFNS